VTTSSWLVAHKDASVSSVAFADGATEATRGIPGTALVTRLLDGHKTSAFHVLARHCRQAQRQREWLVSNNQPFLCTGDECNWKLVATVSCGILNTTCYSQLHASPLRVLWRGFGLCSRLCGLSRRR